MHSLLLAVLAWVHSGSHTSCISMVHDDDFLNDFFGQTLSRSFGDCYVGDNCAYSHRKNEYGYPPHYGSRGFCYFLLNCNATVTYEGNALDTEGDHQSGFTFYVKDGVSYKALYDGESFGGSNKSHIFDLENQTMIYWYPDNRIGYSYQLGSWEICLSSIPTHAPTFFPTVSPTKIPTSTPTASPTKNPSKSPTKGPTASPTVSPTKNPSTSPTIAPTSPTTSPTSAPTQSPNAVQWYQKGDKIMQNSTNYLSDGSKTISLSNNGDIVAVSDFINGTIVVYEFTPFKWTQIGNVIETGLNPNPIIMSLSGNGKVLALVKKTTSLITNLNILVYNYTGTTWEKTSLAPPYGTDKEHFFRKIELSENGERMVSTFLTLDFVGSIAYSFDGTSWIQPGKFLVNFNFDNEGFPPSAFKGKQSVSISNQGDHIAYSTGRQFNQFSRIMKVFQWNGTDWEQMGNSIAEDINSLSLGRFLDISGDGTVLAIGDDNNCYIYEYNDALNDWEPRGNSVAAPNLKDVVLSDSGDRLALIGSTSLNVYDIGTNTAFLDASYSGFLGAASVSSDGFVMGINDPNHFYWQVFFYSTQYPTSFPTDSPTLAPTNSPTVCTGTRNISSIPGNAMANNLKNPILDWCGISNDTIPSCDPKTYNLENVFSLRELFPYAGRTEDEKLKWKNCPLDISNWDVGHVTNMRSIFYSTNFDYFPEIDISKWNVGSVTIFSDAFADTTFNGDISEWDVSSGEDFSSMFACTPSFNKNLSMWNVGSGNKFDYMFGSNYCPYDYSIFNGDITNWDMRNAERLMGMFQQNSEFNQDISGWNVEKVDVMAYLFEGATNFNQNISGWKPNKVRGLASMFRGATSFNQDLSSWDLSYYLANSRDTRKFLNIFSGSGMSCENVFKAYNAWGKHDGILDGTGCTLSPTNSPTISPTAPTFSPSVNPTASPTVSPTGNPTVSPTTPFPTVSPTPCNKINTFTDKTNLRNAVNSWCQDETVALQTYCDISGWDVSGIVNMQGLFRDKTNCNPDISNWNVENVVDMIEMFKDARKFNADISGWNVEKVEFMDNMFKLAEIFDANISGWNVQKVQNMQGMFFNAKEFNADISGWNVGEVTRMNSMFSDAGKFNADISNWEVEKVTDMNHMFFGALDFNADISGWDVRKVFDITNMFSSAESFNRDISGWELKSNVIAASSDFSVLQGTALNCSLQFKIAERFSDMYTKISVEDITACTVSPTVAPSSSPTLGPSKNPTRNPTMGPSKSPTRNPTKNPSMSPSTSPSMSPTMSPTAGPTSPTASPTTSPTAGPTKSPTESEEESSEEAPDAALIGGIAGGVGGAALLGGVGYYVYTQYYALAPGITFKVGKLIF